MIKYDEVSTDGWAVDDGPSEGWGVDDASIEGWSVDDVPSQSWGVHTEIDRVLTHTHLIKLIWYIWPIRFFPTKMILGFFRGDISKLPKQRILEKKVY